MSLHSCWSDDPNDKRVKSDTYMAQDGWIETMGGLSRVPRMVPVTTQWVRKTCGVEPQAGWTDVNCHGCIHDGEATQ